jgi:hypothetical protein
MKEIKREIHLMLNESGLPRQMKDMKTKPLIEQAIGLLEMYYNARNEGKDMYIAGSDTRFVSKEGVIRIIL